jgi:hypothetical protein
MFEPAAFWAAAIGSRGRPQADSGSCLHLQVHEQGVGGRVARREESPQGPDHGSHQGIGRSGHLGQRRGDVGRHAGFRHQLAEAEETRHRGCSQQPLAQCRTQQVLDLGTLQREGHRAHGGRRQQPETWVV